MSSPILTFDDSNGRQRRRAPSQHTPSKEAFVAAPTELLSTFSRLQVDKDQTLQKKLNDEVAIQERHHKAALAEAAREHERIRQNAERARERVELEIERERRRRDAQELEALEVERNAKLTQEADERRRTQESLRREEEARQRRETEELEIREQEARLERQRQKDAADAEEAKRKQLEEENARREDLTRKAKAEAENAAAAEARAKTATNHAVDTNNNPVSSNGEQSHQPTQTQNEPTPQTLSTIQSSAIPESTSQEREQIHSRYLDLHRELKQMRQFVVRESKKMPALKTKLGDWRRQIVKCIGQLTSDKTSNSTRMREIISVLTEAMKHQEPSVDIAAYLISQTVPGGAVRMSGTFIYLVNVFTKAIISQFISEASSSSRAADPVGVATVTVFAQAQFKVNGTIPLIDILLAKFHATCPVIFGIYGNQKTQAGRARIGWWKIDGQWISEQRHFERMTGLASGYAAIALRNFSKSRNESPYPNRHYWHALAHIVNTPAEEVQPTHFIVLKGLIDGSVPKFLGLYGMAALAALKFALEEFPNKAPESVEAKQLKVLPEIMKRDLRLTL